MRNSIPSTRHGSSHMFRNLRDKGERAKMAEGGGKKQIAYDASRQTEEISTGFNSRVGETCLETVSRAWKKKTFRMLLERVYRDPFLSGFLHFEQRNRCRSFLSIHRPGDCFPPISLSHDKITNCPRFNRINQRAFHQQQIRNKRKVVVSEGGGERFTRNRHEFLLETFLPTRASRVPPRREIGGAINPATPTSIEITGLVRRVSGAAGSRLCLFLPFLCTFTARLVALMEMQIIAHGASFTLPSNKRVPSLPPYPTFSFSSSPPRFARSCSFSTSENFIVRWPYGPVSSTMRCSVFSSSLRWNRIKLCALSFTGRTVEGGKMIFPRKLFSTSEESVPKGEQNSKKIRFLPLCACVFRYDIGNRS